MPSCDDLEPDLVFLARMYPLIGHYVAEHGRGFPTHRAECVRKQKDKECFANASRLSAASGWTYCEGFALSPHLDDYWMHHAWCVDGAGHVVDPTWRPTGLYYFGVTIDVGTEHRLIAEGCRYGEYLERLASEAGKGASTSG